MKETLGKFDLYTLIATEGLKPNAYGLRIHGHIQDNTNRRLLSVAQVYASLKRLRELGLIEPCNETQGRDKDLGVGDRAGAPRRYWTVTAKGAQKLEEFYDEITSLRTAPI